jgi:hypothetical protein
MGHWARDYLASLLRRHFQRREPVRIRRILCHVPVVVRGSVVPPHRAAFAKCDLGYVYPLPRQRRRDPLAFSIAHHPSSRHQFLHEPISLVFADSWFAPAPQSAANDEISSIGGVGVPTSIFGFLLHDKGILMRPIGSGCEVAACQLDTTQRFLRFLAACNDTPSEHPIRPLSPPPAHGESRMVDPPAEMARCMERKVELDQTVDYAVQLILEEAICWVGRELNS